MFGKPNRQFIGINILNMIMTITYVLIFLVALNFVLIYTSCNKSQKKKIAKKPYVIKNDNALIVTKELASDQLSPTGS